MAFSFAVAIVISRHRRDVSMAPATCLAQVFLVVVFLPFADPGARCPATTCSRSPRSASGQIGLGLALLTIGARLIPAAQVALITLLEVVLGPLWVWLAVDERPSTATLVGGAIVVAAVVIQARGCARAARRATAVPVRLMARDAGSTSLRSTSSPTRGASRGSPRAPRSAGWDGFFVWDHIVYSRRRSAAAPTRG